MKVVLKKHSCSIDLSGPGYAWTLTLVPGVNSLTDEQAKQFDSLKDNPVVVDLVNRGHLMVDDAVVIQPVAASENSQTPSAVVAPTPDIPVQAEEEDPPQAPPGTNNRGFGRKRK